MKSSIMFFVGLLVCLGTVQAQQEENQTEDKTINGQFENLIRKSTNYRQGGKRYEVVRLLELQALQRNILDSLKITDTNIHQLQGTISENEITLNSLNKSLEEATANVAQLKEEKDGITFFGGMITKSSYKLVVWSIIIGLLILLALFIYKFKNSNTLTKQAKLALADVEEEFEQHRRRSLEREQKISRKLQDEINKNKKGS